MGYNDLGVYGQQLIKLPNIEKLTEEGIKFTDGYAGSSVCSPLIIALLTGFIPATPQSWKCNSAGGNSGSDSIKLSTCSAVVLG